MKVNVNNTVWSVRWRYENTTLNKILKEYNLMEEYLKAKKQKTLVEFADKHNIFKYVFAEPDIVTCIIETDNKSLSAQVKKYHKDPYNKDQARRFSFEKVLKAFTPEARKPFWDAFMARNQNPNVKKCRKILNGLDAETRAALLQPYLPKIQSLSVGNS